MLSSVLVVYGPIIGFFAGLGAGLLVNKLTKPKLIRNWHPEMINSDGSVYQGPLMIAQIQRLDSD
jgi:hypothetical protein